MTKLNVKNGRGYLVSLEEAVETTVNNAGYGGGVIEALQAKLEAQNKLIARMLAVQFGQYGDHFLDDSAPTTEADKLGFILSDSYVSEA